MVTITATDPIDRRTSWLSGAGDAGLFSVGERRSGNVRWAVDEGGQITVKLTRDETGLRDMVRMADELHGDAHGHGLLRLCEGWDARLTIDVTIMVTCRLGPTLTKRRLLPWAAWR